MFKEEVYFYLYSLLRLKNATGLQGDQFNMAVIFWYLGKSDLSSVQWRTLGPSHYLQGTSQTRPCLTVDPVPGGALSSIDEGFNIQPGHQLYLILYTRVERSRHFYNNV